MPTLPNREARLAELIRLGVMPAIAEEAVAWAEARGQTVPTAAEVAREPEPDYAIDIERARAWWLWQPAVGSQWKRLLSARPVGAPKMAANQPRVPAGSPNGGEWTSGGGGGGTAGGGGADELPQHWGRADTERHERFPPTLPQQLERAGGREVHERQLERKAIMERTYPGVRFSTSPYNKLALDQAQEKYGKIPGAGVPNAIYNKNFPAISDSGKIALVRASVQKWGKGSGYVHYTTIKFDTGLSFRELFGVVRHLTEVDPYAVRQSIDRLGLNVNFALRPEGRGWI